jgi:hypothetical protein
LGSSLPFRRYQLISCSSPLPQTAKSGHNEVVTLAFFSIGVVAAILAAGYLMYKCLSSLRRHTQVAAPQPGRPGVSATSRAALHSAWDLERGLSAPPPQARNPDMVHAAAEWARSMFASRPPPPPPPPPKFDPCCIDVKEVVVVMQPDG